MSKFAYVGTYGGNNGKGKGIYVYQVDPSTGSLNFLETIVSDSASFMCTNKKRDRLYVVNELSDHDGQHGEVTAFKVDASNGKLTLLNKTSSLGVWPCHITMDPSEKFILVSNYGKLDGKGSFDTFSLKPDGSLDQHVDNVTHEGSGPNPERQEASHAHMIMFDHQGKRVILVDLGIDKTLLYEFDAKTGKLTPTGVTGDANPGSGPRHLAESKDGRFYYVINELDATISVFTSQNFSMVQTVSTLPSDGKFTGKNQCSEIMLHPNGKFLYGSNRGHDSIVIFSLDPNTGLLKIVGHESTQGSFPRHFQIHPSNGHIYVANQRSDNIVIFKMDDASGKLKPTGQVVNVPNPVYIEFI